MKFTAKITNEEKYDNHEIDLSGIRHRTGSGSLIGDVEIDGRTITGEHGPKSYVEEYGFEIVPDRRFRIEANDADMGVYQGENEQDALDAYARDAGYKDYQDVIDQFGDDAVAVEVK